MQERLKKLGYISYSGSASGTYETKTATAVEKFQRTTGFKVNKKLATAAMQQFLFSEEAPHYDVMTSTPSSVNGNPHKPTIGTVVNVDWYGSKKDYYFNSSTGIFKIGTIATFVDIDTGICYQVRRKGGSLHADFEPYTAFDTWQMFRTYKNKWSWDRRAVFVVVHVKGDEYVTIAASVNGMPHDTSYIMDNNVDGHFCCHFMNSKTHGTNKVDKDHQAMVKKAYNANVAAVQAKIDAQPEK